jgi:hypothetical protein
VLLFEFVKLSLLGVLAVVFISFICLAEDCDYSFDYLIVYFGTFVIIFCLSKFAVL